MSMPPSGGPQDPNGSGDQWGQQPPQVWGQQPGQPGQQGPQQPQQWGQQPPQQWGPPQGGQQWGPPPGGGPGGPQQWGGEPPKKSRTGVVVAAVVALLVLVGGGAAAVVALSGDGDRVVSDGYSYEIPDEWIDATEELSAAGAPGSIDTVIAWGSQLQGSRANMIVETQAAGGATDPEEMRAQWEATMTQAAGGEAPEAAEGITVDGVDSIGVRFQRDNGAGIEIVQRAYLMISGDTAYAITLSYQPDDDGVVSDTFDEIIDSWDFTD